MMQTTVSTNRARGGDRHRGRLPFMNDFHDGEAKTRADADLLDILLLGLDGDAPHGRADQPVPERRDAERLGSVDQQIPALLLVLVTRQSRVSQERRGVLPPRRPRGEEALPVAVKHPEDVLRDVGRQRLVGFLILPPLVHLRVREGDRLEEDGVPQLIMGHSVAVLGGEGGGGDRGEARVSALDDRRLNEWHPALLPPSLPTPTQSPRSGAWPAAAQRAARSTRTRWPSDRPIAPRLRFRPG